MQNAKDTFYVVLCDRIAALNPQRTIVVRGVARPGVVVAENELVSAVELPDIFRLQWTELRVDANGPMPLVAMRCEIRYCSDGSAMNGGMDRGHVLAGMDAELASALGTAPQYATKMNYLATAQGGAATAMATNIFWGDVVFSNLTTENERLGRVATVEIFSYQEAGEL
jgi:hypothetical protein